jgi:hypothetical protein
VEAIRTHLKVTTKYMSIIAATVMAPAAAMTIWFRCKGVANRYRPTRMKAEYNETMVKSKKRKLGIEKVIQGDRGVQ